ncbi:MAG: multicopper oxidase domain-containing protein [Chloroflexi bacterium]|nr:multicopper oxidase domain-containing protein [Chloroflexota bacterium]
MLSRREFLKLMALVPVGVSLHWWSGSTLAAQAPAVPIKKHKGRIKPGERKAAAKNAAQQGLKPGVAAVQTATMNPGGIPHYFGPFANYANSPVPTGAIAAIALASGGSRYTSPTVTISDAYGTGSGATASATVSGGVITGISIGNAGANYSGPVVSIQDATGTGASASATIGGALTGGIRKFVDALPGVGYANRNLLGQYIPQAIPDTTTYADADYYEIELGEYSEQMHSDLPLKTRLRGYRQTNTTDPTVSQFHYLGPLIVVDRDRPVRIKFTNNLPTGSGGDLFIPVDKTVMGAGMGPLDMIGMPGMKEEYKQNRATLHLHGGFTPWISDGTPHQWTTPATETTQYPKGVSVVNVPDMPDPGPGSLTFYYTNAQSARLMFYHDHAYGITRLNVYSGEAAPYLITDQVEKDLINGSNVSGVNPTNAQLLPDVGTPLVIQDKTFVDAAKIAGQDPTWSWGGTGSGAGWLPQTGDLWFPSVYMPAQNPWDPTGANAFGRWQYGPWFWPPTTTITHPPVPNEYYDPVNAPWEPPMRPDMPRPSMGMEAFMDTPVVNGTAYPYMDVDPKTYRFRILNAADDRFFNLHMYVADSTVTTSDGRSNTEVKMVPAAPTAGFPAKWPTDGRAGGVPDPTTQGPSWIQIGNECGFLPAPVVIDPQPINYNTNPLAFNFGNVTDHSLLLGCAERADVLVDFSAFAGKTIILYNDAPAGFPAIDTRYDYYTGDPSQVDTGGAPATQPGFGPNTRTIMQFRVSNATPAATYDVSALKTAFAKTASKRGVFEVSHDPIIVPQAAYNSAYNANFPNTMGAQYVQIADTSKTFTPIGATSPVTISLQPKALHDEMGASYDTAYGRQSGILGLELPSTTSTTQNFLLYPFASPPVDLTNDSTMTQIGQAGDGTQIWRITHNGVDDHAIHWHLVNVQLINRVAWDGALLPPDPNELGWKETVRVNPLEHAIIAFRPVVPPVPFDLPNSIRLLDPTMPDGTPLNAPPAGFTDPAAVGVTVTNHKVNFGHEYVWHCHLLSHEEMDMMHPLLFAVAPKTPTALTAVVVGSGTTKKVVLNWTHNTATATGYTVQRATDSAFTTNLKTFQVTTNVTTYQDVIGNVTPSFYYRVRATNVVGDTATYTGSSGFPTETMVSGWSDPAAPGKSPIPQAPSNLVATISSATQIHLTWKDNSDNETAFVIQRSVNGAAFSVLKQVAAAAGVGTTVAANDGTVQAWNTYAYQVMAVNGTNQSPFSNVATVSFTVPATPSGLTATAARITGTPQDTVTLNWTDNSNNETGFRILRATNAAFTANVTIINVTQANKTTKIDTVSRFTTYYYKVRAVNLVGMSTWSNTVSVKTP